MPRSCDPERKVAAVQAYRRRRAAGERVTIAQVAKEHGLGEATLKRANWLYRGDDAGLPPAKPTGRPLKVTDEEVLAAAEFARGNPSVTWADVVAYVEERFHRTVSASTLRRRLKMMGIRKVTVARGAGEAEPRDVTASADHRYTDKHRRKAARGSSTRRYPSDMSDAEWAVLEPVLQASASAMPERHDARAILDALRYQARTGCQWRYLPNDFPPWRTVQNWFMRWSRDETFDRVVDALREQVRAAEGRERSPSLLILDSQSAKKTEKGGPAATTPGRRSRARSGTSSSTPSDCSSMS